MSTLISFQIITGSLGIGRLYTTIISFSVQKNSVLWVCLFCLFFLFLFLNEISKLNMSAIVSFSILCDWGRSCFPQEITKNVLKENIYRKTHHCSLVRSYGRRTTSDVSREWDILFYYFYSPNPYGITWVCLSLQLWMNCNRTTFRVVDAEWT